MAQQPSPPAEPQQQQQQQPIIYLSSSSSSTPKKLPPVRQNKKSSYKPLSKLNGDRLTDLSRSERPEYTGRVFYQGLAARARLRHDVNIWFREHQHSLALLQREQRAVQTRRGRMVKDVRRAKRDHYRRTQEDIRDKLSTLQLRLLQRRVVQSFQRNAMAKMAARGEQSLVALRKRGLDPSDVILLNHSRSEDPSAVTGHAENTSSDGIRDVIDIVAEETEKLSAASLLLHQNQGLRNGRDLDEYIIKKNNDQSGAHTESEEIRRQSSPQRKISVSRRIFSEGDDNVAPLERGLLHIIPEHSGDTDTATDGLGDNTVEEEEEAGGRENKGIPDNDPKENASIAKSQVLEVRKNRPQSPRTRSISRPPLHTLPQPGSKLKPLPPVSKNKTPLSTTTEAASATEITDASSDHHHHIHHRNHHHNQRDHQSRTSNFASSSSSPQHHPVHTPGQNSDQNTSSRNIKKPNAQSYEKGAGKKVARGINKKALVQRPEEVEKAQPVFRPPDRAQVMEDLAVVLGEVSHSREGGQVLGSSGRGSQGGSVSGVSPRRSLAAALRQQRKREAKRRTELLNREPLVQYYRSVRGTLEPLMSQPSRKSFPFPSGRGQYEQHKLLREELQKDVERRRDMDNFFSTIPTSDNDPNQNESKRQQQQQQTQQQQPAPPQNKAAASTKEAQGGGPGVNALLRMGQAIVGGGGGSSQEDSLKDPQSLQRLAACHYLRPYDWDREPGDKDSTTALTSWANAESSLKAGFLALDFTTTS